MVSSKKSNTIAAVGTVIFMVLVFLLLWFICIDRIQEPEDEGIEIAFGNAEEGGGFQQEQVTGGLTEETVAPLPAPQDPSNNDLIAQEDEKSVEVQHQHEEAEKARQQAERERQERERALAEQRAKEQAAIAKANQFGSLFGNNSGGSGSGDTQDDSQRGNSEVGKGSSGGTSWSLAGRSVKALPKPSNDFKQEGKVVVAIIVDGSGKVVSAKATEGTTISNDATIQLALKAAYKAEFSFTDRPDKQFGTITYIFKFN